MHGRHWGGRRRRETVRCEEILTMKQDINCDERERMLNFGAFSCVVMKGHGR